MKATFFVCGKVVISGNFVLCAVNMSSPLGFISSAAFHIALVRYSGKIISRGGLTIPPQHGVPVQTFPMLGFGRGYATIILHRVIQVH